jgi:hypothetical protein
MNPITNLNLVLVTNTRDNINKNPKETSYEFMYWNYVWQKVNVGYCEHGHKCLGSMQMRSDSTGR